MLTENLLLALPAGGLGVLLTLWSANLLVHSFNLTVRLPANLVDGTAITFTMAVSVFSVLIVGTVPSLEATRLDLAPSLKEGGARAGAGLRRHWMRRAFLVVQTSIALALVATAALTFKAVRALHRVDPGFRTANLVLVDLKPAPWRYTNDMAARSCILEAMHRLRELPQVGSVGVVSAVPCIDSNGIPTTFVPADRPEPPPAERRPATVFWRGRARTRRWRCPWCAGARSKRATARARRGSSS